MDINQKLWKRKITKIHRKKNVVLKLKRKFKKIKENELTREDVLEKMNTGSTVEAELAKKKLKFYDEIFKEGKGAIEEEEEETRPENNPRVKNPKKERIAAATKGKKIDIEESAMKPAAGNGPAKGRKKSHLNFYEEKLRVKQARQDSANELELQDREKRKTEKLKEKKLQKKAFTEKTKRGQPLMKNYINLLLNKIQKTK